MIFIYLFLDVGIYCSWKESLHDVGFAIWGKMYLKIVCDLWIITTYVAFSIAAGEFLGFLLPVLDYVFTVIAPKNITEPFHYFSKHIFFSIQ